MNELKDISKVFESAQEILFDQCSRIVLMSDCHRGIGDWIDNFSKNQNIYFAALTYYYNANYTYIEVGDGDELWETNNLTEIINVHSDVFWLLSKFFMKDRLYFIFGNHDMVKRDGRFVKNNLYQYYNEPQRRYIPLFENIKIHEGLVLRHKETDDKILVIHGHQADYINYKLWKLSRFLVRYLWKPLESLGVNDPTSTAKNYNKKDAVEKKLTDWVKKEGHILIAGHTHRPSFPEIGDIPYFNDGSCVHPRCITAIEIIQDSIVLVKWSIKTKNDGALFIGKDVLAGPRNLDYYFNELY
ncbi:metallophosphoesterase [Clostridium vincentii]|uniref:Calcineurin-like phosphoesterase superfamily domain protein n=1 Tax=Clostridium vincentii TaxID=52704 RepID=A0A2T0BB66_9CLOT|nr:metallophosphoesterase [Clostridium vincentii]PRR81057.1 Calcineurin-like phosphoesterase superfamily domain protein [Clostridium vincentii]